MKIRPARRVKGQLQLPGDKSISHRVAIVSALAQGRTRVENFSTSEDCARTLSCLAQLGVHLERTEENTVSIEGVGLQGLRAPGDVLDCGNSGSTMRLLAGVLAGQDFVSTLTGDESLRARPMKRIIEPLEMMGARIESENGCAPLRIIGNPRLRAINYEMPLESAQVKSAILLAGLNASGRTEVTEKQGATRDHTECLLRWLGVEVTNRPVQESGTPPREAISIEGGAPFKARDGFVPGDISAAAFFITAAALLPGSKLKISRVGLNPTRTRLLSVLRPLGADVHVDSLERSDDEWRGAMEDFDEPFGNLSIKGGAGLAPQKQGKSNVLSGTLSAQLIDELPVLAVLGSQVLGGFEIRDAGELRLKESDRLRATIDNLRAMGAEVEESADGLRITKRTQLRGARLDAHKDHRIAMAFTVAALIAEGESEIVGARECVGVSFPEFYELLDSVIER